MGLIRIWEIICLTKRGVNFSLSLFLKFLASAFEIATLLALVPIIGQDWNGKVSNLARYISLDLEQHNTLLLFVCCGICYTFVTYIYTSLQHKTSREVVESLRNETISIHKSLTPRQARLVKSDQVQHFVNNEVTHIARAIVNAIDAASDIIILFMNLLFLFFYSTSALQFTLAFSGLIAFSYISFSKTLKSESAKLIKTAQESSQVSSNFLNRLPISILHGTASYESNALKNIFKTMKVTEMTVIKSRAKITFAYEALGLLYIAAFIGYTLNNNLHLGATLVFLTLFYRLSPRIIYIQKALIQFRMAENAINSFMNFRQLTKRSNSELKNNESISEISSIELKNITKITNDKKILVDISLKLQKGKSYAILGPTGHGKTTILEMLIGLQEPELGKVIVNGKNLHSIDLKSYYDKVSLVSADDDLIAGSLTENIIMADDFSHSRLDFALNAAALSSLWDLNRVVKNEHQLVSQGEKQRILMARALYRKPEFLLLDEATCHLDEATENQVLKNLLSYNKHFVLVIVTHRKHTLPLFNFAYTINNSTLVKFAELSRESKHQQDYV